MKTEVKPNSKSRTTFTTSERIKLRVLQVGDGILLPKRAKP